MAENHEDARHEVPMLPDVKEQTVREAYRDRANKAVLCSDQVHFPALQVNQAPVEAIYFAPPREKGEPDDTCDGVLVKPDGAPSGVYIPSPKQKVSVEHSSGTRAPVRTSVHAYELTTDLQDKMRTWLILLSDINQ